jgi:hypothetical protein
MLHQLFLLASSLVHFFRDESSNRTNGPLLLMRIKAKGCDYALLHLPPLRFTVPEDGGMIGIESDIDRNGSEASLNNSQPPDPPLISLHTT